MVDSVPRTPTERLAAAAARSAGGVAAAYGSDIFLGDGERNTANPVMAHELAHVKNRDTLISTIAATIAGVFSMLAYSALFFGGSREGGGLGALAGRIWRIGLMGENARIINVEALRFALRKELGG